MTTEKRKKTVLDLEELQQQALEYTRESLDHMKRHGVQPEGKIGLFLPPKTRQKEIHRLPYTQKTRQVVIYETEKGEFTALCPFSGLPDHGFLRIEYVPGSWILELKSLKYYIISWRNIGETQESITAYIYEDLIQHLDDPEYLKVTLTYNIRGGIRTTCTANSDSPL